MPGKRLAFLAFQFLLLLPAQQPQVAAKPESKISGKVIALINGKAVADARLTLKGALETDIFYSAKSDHEGNFVFSDVKPAIYRLFADSTGFVPKELGNLGNGIPGPGSLLDLRTRRVSENLVIKLAPATSLTGRIIDAEGNPVGGAQVRMLEFQHGLGVRLMPVKSIKASPNGNYVLHNVPPGEYYLSAGPSDDNPGFGPVFYPGTPYAPNARTIGIAPGTHLRDVDFVLSKTRTTLTGALMLADGERPVPKANVALISTEERAVGLAGRILAVDDPEGKFRITGVAPGNYELIVDATGLEQPLAGRMFLAAGNEDLRDLRVALRPPVEISGNVRAEPVPNFRLGLMKITFIPTEGAFRKTIDAAVNDDGNFVLRGLLPIRYSLMIRNVPPGLALKSSRWESQQDVARRGIDLSKAGGGALQIEFGVNRGAIRGVVRGQNDRPVPAATVQILLLGSGGAGTLASNNDGMFIVPGLAAGTYRVYAWEEISFAALGNPDILRRFEHMSSLIHLQEGETAAVEPRLIPAEAWLR